jgi:hypothetical protein
MNTPAEDIKDMLLAESSFDLTLGTNLFVGHEPPNPDNVVIIFDRYGGPSPVTLDGQVYEYTSGQIMVRNRDYQVAQSLVGEIKEALHGRANETWNGSFYTLILCSVPSMLDWDDGQRVRFIINLNLQRR